MELVCCVLDCGGRIQNRDGRVFKMPKQVEFERDLFQGEADADVSDDDGV